MISQDISMRGNKTQGKKENTHHQFKLIFKYDVVLVVVGRQDDGTEGVIMGEA